MVIEREDKAGQQCLYAYIVAAGSSVDGIKEYLAKHLPSYMIPAFFVPVDKIPLTPNGKVDRKKMPEPGVSTTDRYIPPRTATQKNLVRIWSEVLGSGDGG